MNTIALRPVEELLWSWPTVCRMATNEWAKGFAASIAKQSRRRNWSPSPKQHKLMQQLVSDLYRYRGDFDGTGDFDVIED